jgi:hypothetical protein
MLSATPVNNRFNDLKNQIALAYEGDSKKIDGLLNTSSSIDDIFRQAQKEYNRWAKLPPKERTTKRLLERLSFDFFEVLDSVTIARSRKHIEQYYDTTDIGKFPTRRKPISRHPKLTDLENAISYNEIYILLQVLNLTIYTPSDFILPSRKSKYMPTGDDEEYAGLTVNGRELGIRKLMSMNLLKRLEIRGVETYTLTSHMGLGNFKAVEVEDLSKHKVESEQISISAELVQVVDKAHEGSKRICAIGTEVMRALEHVVGTNGQLKAYEGWTNKFIYPPYDFTVANAFFVNFYMPMSTQLIMVAAFGGQEHVMRAYKEAVKEGYRFGDYGDAMLILND